MGPADDILSPELSALVNDEMAAGERIVWVGQPIPSRYARRSVVLMLFGTVFTAFAVFWVAAASQFKLPDFTTGFGLFPLFGLPFVLVGLAMLTSPYWMLRKARRTAYAITDRRALILDGSHWGSTTVRSFASDRLLDLQRTQFADGSGHLIFQRYHTGNPQNNGQLMEVGFIAIPQVKEVEELLRELIRKSGNA